MANESEFQKLLSEAPMAPNADTVTVVGTLSRTADASRFVLTLPDGRTVTLDVDLVKSAKTVAGAVGQTMVQLELDAKRTPDGLRDFRPDQPQLNYKVPAAESHPAIAELNTFIADQGHTGVFDPINTGPFDPINTGPFDPIGTGAFDPMGSGAFPNTAWYADTASHQAAPFVAATPHQANPETIAALTQPQPGTPHYLSHIFKSVPQMDVPHPPKQPIQDGTNPWNSFDITGGGAFDVITYNQGNPTYHY